MENPVTMPPDPKGPKGVVGSIFVVVGVWEKDKVSESWEAESLNLPHIPSSSALLRWGGGANFRDDDGANAKLHLTMLKTLVIAIHQSHKDCCCVVIILWYDLRFKKGIIAIGSATLFGSSIGVVASARSELK